MLQQLEQRREALISFTATARIEVKKYGVKRSYDSASVALDGKQRLRLDIYDPFGMAMFSFVWNGTEAFYRRQGERITHAGKDGLEQIFGAEISPPELWAILTGNAPASGPAAVADLRCTPDQAYVLDLRDKDAQSEVRVRLVGKDNSPLEIASIQLSRSGEAVYRAEYGEYAAQNNYRLPQTVSIESPAKHITVSIRYSDAEVNSPLGDEVFTLAE
jgi:hypothetical protein